MECSIFRILERTLTGGELALLCVFGFHCNKALFSVCVEGLQSLSCACMYVYMYVCILYMHT